MTAAKSKALKELYKRKLKRDKINKDAIIAALIIDGVKPAIKAKLNINKKEKIKLTELLIYKTPKIPESAFVIIDK